MSLGELLFLLFGHQVIEVLPTTGFKAHQFVRLSSSPVMSLTPEHPLSSGPPPQQIPIHYPSPSTEPQLRHDLRLLARSNFLDRLPLLALLVALESVNRRFV